MCGRACYTFDETKLEMKKLGSNPINLNFEKNFNLSPTEDIPTLFFDEHLNDFKVEAGFWWLIPSWCKEIDVKKAGYTFNAKGETLLEKKSFKDNAITRRCEVILSGFIEWQYLDKKQKRPYLIQRTDKKPLVLAAIYSNCNNRKTVSIITVKANKLMSTIHNKWKFDRNKEPRMPLVLVDEDRKLWHDKNHTHKTGIQEMIDSYHKSNRIHFEAFRIDPSIGNARNKNESLLKPIDGEILLI